MERCTKCGRGLPVDWTECLYCKEGSIQFIPAKQEQPLPMLVLIGIAGIFIALAIIVVIRAESFWSIWIGWAALAILLSGGSNPFLGALVGAIIFGIVCVVEKIVFGVSTFGAILAGAIIGFVSSLANKWRA